MSTFCLFSALLSCLFLISSSLHFTYAGYNTATPPLTVPFNPPTHFPSLSSSQAFPAFPALNSKLKTYEQFQNPIVFPVSARELAYIIQQTLKNINNSSNTPSDQSECEGKTLEQLEGFEIPKSSPSTASSSQTTILFFNLINNFEDIFPHNNLCRFLILPLVTTEHTGLIEFELITDNPTIIDAIIQSWKQISLEVVKPLLYNSQSQFRILDSSNQQKPVSSCPDGFYLTSKQLCKQCPLPCKKCTSDKDCIECKATEGVLSQICLCKIGFHFYFQKTSNSYICINLQKLLDQTKFICQSNQGFVQPTIYGSFCFGCSSDTCLRCSFTLNESFDKEKCERCIDPQSQMSITDNTVCLRATADCKNNSACLKCQEINNNQSCSNCSTGFLLQDSNCITFSWKLSHPVNATQSSELISSTIGLTWEDDANPNDSTGLDPGSDLSCQIGEIVAYNYTDNTFNCISCGIPHCISCIQVSKCETCDLLYLLDHQTFSCFQCKTSQFFNSSSQQCQDCPDTCSQCQLSSDGNMIDCIECNDTYEIIDYNSQKLCLKKCNNNQYRSNNTYVCIDCPDSCLSCISSTECQVCNEQEGYYFLDKIGISENPIRFTEYKEILKNLNGNSEQQLFSSSSTCLKLCQPSEYLTANLENSRVLLSGSKTPKQSPNSSRNTKYKSLFYPNISGRSLRIKWDDRGKGDDDSLNGPTYPELIINDPRDDNSGQTITLNISYLCNQQIGCEISHLNSNACIECSNGYYMKGWYKTCQMSLSCAAGYFFDPYSVSCLLCPALCSACASSLLCTECNELGQLSNESQLCVPKSTSPGTESQCTLEFCTKCGYSKIQEELCFECDETLSVIFEFKCFSRDLLNCDLGYYAKYSYESKAIRCTKCPSKCKDCFNSLLELQTESESVICRECNEGYILSSSQLMCLSQSELSCPVNSALQKISQNDTSSLFFCRICHKSCLTCQPYSPANSCTSCANDYYSYSSLAAPFTCTLICPEKFYISSSNKICKLCEIDKCFLCSQDNTCASCEHNFVLSDDKKSCLPAKTLPLLVCPLGAVYIPDTDSCLCSNDQTFIYPICTKLKTYYNPSSTVDCSNGLFYSSTTNSCQLCPFNTEISENIVCLECNDSLSCLRCAQGFYLANLTCQPCPDNCVECSISNMCLRCSLGYFQQFNQTSMATACVSTCSDGYLPSLDSAYFMNVQDTFQQRTYYDFVSNLALQEAQKIQQNLTLSQAIAMLNHSAVYFVPDWFNVISITSDSTQNTTKIISTFYDEKIYMACLICSNNCSICPNGYNLDASSHSCVQILDDLSQQDEEDESQIDISYIHCLNCWPSNTQTFFTPLVLGLRTNLDNNTLSNIIWDITDVSSPPSDPSQSINENTKQDLIQIIQQYTQNCFSVNLTIPVKILQSNLVYNFSVSFIENNLSTLRYKVITLSDKPQYRRSEEIGISSTSSLQSILLVASSQTYPIFAYLPLSQINYFFLSPVLFEDQFLLSITFTYASTSSSFYHRKSLGSLSSFQGELSLQEYLQFTSSVDYLTITFDLVHSQSQIHYLTSLQVEFSHESLNIYNLSQDTTQSILSDSEYIFNLSTALHRQMLGAELTGDQTVLNRELDSTTAAQYSVQPSSKGQLMGDFVSMVTGNSGYGIDIQGIEEALLAEGLGETYQKSKILSSCANPSKFFGYYCNMNLNQFEYFKMTIPIITGRILSLLRSATDNNQEETRKFALLSVQFLTRFASNNQTNLDNFQEILRLIPKNSTAGEINKLRFNTLLFLQELKRRNRIELPQESSPTNSTTLTLTTAFSQIQSLIEESSFSQQSSQSIILHRSTSAEFQTLQASLPSASQEQSVSLNQNLTLTLSSFPSSSSGIAFTLISQSIQNSTTNITDISISTNQNLTATLLSSLTAISISPEHPWIAFNFSNSNSTKRFLEQNNNIYSNSSNVFCLTTSNVSCQIIAASVCNCSSASLISLALAEWNIFQLQNSSVASIPEAVNFLTFNILLNLNKFTISLLILLTIYCLVPLVFSWKCCLSQKLNLKPKSSDLHPDSNSNSQNNNFPTTNINLNQGQDNNNLIPSTLNRGLESQEKDLKQQQPMKNSQQSKLSFTKQLAKKLDSPCQQLPEVSIPAVNNLGANEEIKNEPNEMVFKSDINCIASFNPDEPTPIESFAQIKQFESIVIQIPQEAQKQQSISKECPQKQLEKQEPFLGRNSYISIIFHVLFSSLIGIKRPFVQLLQIDSSLQTIIIILLSLSEISQCLILVFYLEIYQTLPIMFGLHLLITLILNSISKQFNRFLVFPLIILVLVLILSLLIFFGLVFPSKNLTQAQFIKYSDDCLTSIVADLTVVQSIIALISVICFKLEVPALWIYDYNACITYFSVNKLEIPRMFQQILKAKEKSDENRSCKNKNTDTPVVSKQPGIEGVLTLLQKNPMSIEGGQQKNDNKNTDGGEALIKNDGCDGKTKALKLQQHSTSTEILYESPKQQLGFLNELKLMHSSEFKPEEKRKICEKQEEIETNRQLLSHKGQQTKLQENHHQKAHPTQLESKEINLDCIFVTSQKYLGNLKMSQDIKDSQVNSPTNLLNKDNEDKNNTSIQGACMVPELLEGLDNLICAERTNLAATENIKRPTRKRKQNDKKQSKQNENKNNKLDRDDSDNISIPAENSIQKNKIDLRDFEMIVNTLNK